MSSRSVEPRRRRYHWRQRSPARVMNQGAGLALVQPRSGTVLLSASSAHGVRAVIIFEAAATLVGRSAPQSRGRDLLTRLIAWLHRHWMQRGNPEMQKIVLGGGIDWRIHQRLLPRVLTVVGLIAVSGPVPRLSIVR